MGWSEITLSCERVCVMMMMLGIFARDNLDGRKDG